MMEEAEFNQHLDEFNKITTELASLEVKIKEEDKLCFYELHCVHILIIS